MSDGFILWSAIIIGLILGVGSGLQDIKEKNHQSNCEQIK